MKDLKKNMIIARVTGAVMGILFGVLILVLAAILQPSTVQTIIHWTLIICGIFTIISNIPELISGIGHVNTAVGLIDLISAVLGILFGLALIFFQSTVLVVIIGIYLILFPLLRVLTAADKGKQLLREVWRLAMGVLLLVFLPLLMDAAFTVVHILLLVVGWLLIAVSLISGIISVIGILRVSRSGETTASGTVYADTTGDGRIDTIYMDTDGDGSPDTTVHIEHTEK